MRRLPALPGGDEVAHGHAEETEGLWLKGTFGGDTRGVILCSRVPQGAQGGAAQAMHSRNPVARAAMWRRRPPGQGFEALPGRSVFPKGGKS